MYEQLYEENKWMLRTFAECYRSACEKDRAFSMEDLVQIAFLGLVKGWETFDETRHKSWGLHVKWCIQSEIEKALNIKGRKNEHIHMISLDEPLGADESDGDTMADLLEDSDLPPLDEGILCEEVQKSIHKALAALTDSRQRQIIERYMLNGCSIEDIAHDLTLTPYRVRQLYRRGLIAMSQDAYLRALMDLDERTRFHAHKGVKRFQSEGSSVVEDAVIWRSEQSPY